MYHSVSSFSTKNISVSAQKVRLNVLSALSERRRLLGAKTVFTHAFNLVVPRRTPAWNEPQDDLSERDSHRLAWFDQTWLLRTFWNGCKEEDSEGVYH